MKIISSLIKCKWCSREMSKSALVTYVPKANVGIIFKNATDYINFLKKLLP